MEQITSDTAKTSKYKISYMLNKGEKYVNYEEKKII